MPFDTTPVLDVTVTPRDAGLLVAWRSSAPAGSLYQLYVGGRHVWTGAARSARVPRPAGPAWLCVGVVGPAEASADFAASLPAPPGGGGRIKLSWVGGLFLGADLLGFRVYLGPAPGAPVGYATPVGRVAAYAQACRSTGYGMGGYGAGGYGNSAASYSWTGGPYAAGVWNYAVVPYGRSGNLGTPAAGAVTVAGPPAPVPRGPGGVRVAARVNRLPSGGYGSGGYGGGGYGTGLGGYGSGGYGEGGYGVGGPAGAPYVTLTWLPSPG